MTQPTVPDADDLRARFERLRGKEFPWTAEATYLNAASIGPLPARARRVLVEHAGRRATPYTYSDRELGRLLRDARAAAARIIDAETEEIALATNTSFGLNVAAGALPIGRGDVVVVSEGEFPANVYPWLALERRGVRVELVPTGEHGWPDEDRLLDRIADPAVRVLAISLVQFANGYRADLGRLGAACREHDTWLVVDAIQGLGQVPFSVKETPVDILSSGAQKWLLSPWGSGFFYVRRALVAELVPPFAGWLAFEGTDDFTKLTDYSDTLRTDARRFEVGTLPFPDMAAMTASLGLLEEVGIDRIAGHLARVREPILDGARRGAFEVTSPIDPDHGSAILRVAVRDPTAAHRRLTEAKVTCALREGAIRLSPHCYNSVEELAHVAELLAGR